MCIYIYTQLYEYECEYEYICVYVYVQFVADGVFFAELNEVLTRELAEDGYSGVEVRVTPMRTEIIIRATRTQNVLGDYSSYSIVNCYCYCFFFCVMICSEMDIFFVV